MSTVSKMRTATLQLLCGILSAGGAAAGGKKPNLLFMMTDQQRSDTIGLVTPSLSTPNMDRIGKEGALFKWEHPDLHPRARRHSDGPKAVEPR